MGTMTKKTGFTLVELTVSTTILTVVSALMFLVMQSSTSAIGLAEAKETAQGALRDTLGAMTQELQLASKATNAALVPPLQALQVVNPQEIVFQVPVNSFGTVWSTPITYRFVNEDAGEHEGANNGRLDEGEDVDGDGALTRRVLRIQDGNARPLVPCNDLSSVQFALNATNDVLAIMLTASKATQNRRHDLSCATATSQVYLQN